MNDRRRDLQDAYGQLLAGRFAAAARRAAPWAAEPDGALLHALALAGSGKVERAAPLLAAIGDANPDRDHPVQDLLRLLPPGAGLPHLRAALRERPDDARLLGALGALLAETGPMDEAVDAFQRVVALRPGNALGWSNLGKALAAEGEWDEAEAAFARALALTPGDARIAYNRAVSLLKSGRLAEGWRALRVRHALPGRPPPLPGPRLENLDVAGRTVLLRHEEGFGDTLQFVRYATALADRGARVVLAMPPALERITRTVPGVADVVPHDVPASYDVWAPLLDVPALFEGAVPGAVPYLRADSPAPRCRPAARSDWSGPATRTGCWTAPAPCRKRRLSRCGRCPNVVWVSLQKGAPAPPWMLDPMNGVRDFADTAGIVAQLDLVVSVDTAVTHLAGGLGKPVLLMDRYDACWRWGVGREDSDWYPGLRIVRQTRPGDWGGVVRRVAEAVSAR